MELISVDLFFTVWTKISNIKYQSVLYSILTLHVIITSFSTVLTGKPECYTMKLWLPSCPSKTVVDIISSYVVLQLL